LRKNSMNDADIPRHSAGYRLEDFGDELVLYHFTTTQVVYLNDTASLIWRLCDGRRSIADIKTLIQEAYPSAPGQVEADLRRTLAQFVESGAMELL
jgi:pyrroloquinoline quinone biosynthesis protein D